MTTLTLLSQEPLLGIFLEAGWEQRQEEERGGERAAERQAAEKLCTSGRAAAAVPPKPPRNGATQAKLMIVKVIAMNIVPTSRPAFAAIDVNRARLLGSSISYMPNRLSAKKMNSRPGHNS